MTGIPYQAGKIVNGRLELSAIQIIHPERCTHFIMVGEHYRPDGTCRCNDPTHLEMADWGYEWGNGGWQSSQEEE